MICFCYKNGVSLQIDLLLITNITNNETRLENLFSAKRFVSIALSHVNRCKKIMADTQKLLRQLLNCDSICIGEFSENTWCSCYRHTQNARKQILFGIICIYPATFINGTQWNVHMHGVRVIVTHKTHTKRTQKTLFDIIFRYR